MTAQEAVERARAYAEALDPRWKRELTEARILQDEDLFGTPDPVWVVHFHLSNDELGHFPEIIEVNDVTGEVTATPTL